MPYEITREPRGAYKRFWGIVTPAEFLESVRNFHNDPYFETIRYTINDFTETESFVMADTHIDDTAAINLGSSYTNPRIKVLAVTTDPIIIAMAKKYDQLNQHAPILICATLQEAREWLQQQSL